MNLKTQYILVAVKKEEYLQELLKELEGYITKSTSNGDMDIKHNLENFTTYIEIKKGARGWRRRGYSSCPRKNICCK